MHRSVRALAALSVLAAQSVFAAPRIEIDPATFDFGWAPDNAKVTAQFIIRNTSSEMVPLTSVIPNCGCTAATFSPTNVGSSEETKISLTFNTRGFANMAFKKPSRIETDSANGTFVATMAGHVTNSAALLLPEGDGIAGFEKDAPSKKKKISIVNKTGRDITLKAVQAPADWATVKLPDDAVKAGEKAVIEISVDGTNENRTTSVTLAPADAPSDNRVTLAIFSGQGPPAYRINPVANPKPKAPSASSPAALPPTPASVPAQKKAPAAPASKAPPKAKGAPVPNK